MAGADSVAGCRVLLLRIPVRRFGALESEIETPPSEVSAGNSQNSTPAPKVPKSKGQKPKAQGPSHEESWKEEILNLSKMPTVQHPLVYGRDASNPYYDFLYRLVERYKPRLVVELGTCTGGSASYLAACPETRVISVDIVQHPEVVNRLAAFPNVELWTFDTRDPALKATLEKEGPIDLIFVDTEHTYAQAKAEFEALSTLLSPTAFVLFDDLRMNGVAQFWSELDCSKLELNHLHWSGFGAVPRAPA